MEKPRSSKKAGLVEIGSIRVDRSIEQQRGSCWEDCLSNQFPVTSFENVGNLSVFTVGAPHEGYTIETQLENNKMNGESSIISDEEIKVAKLFFQDGIANGPCTLYDSLGKLFFTGRFVNGYRSGRGKEYDTQGNVVFDGFFREGKKMKVYPVNEMKGYWKELADDNSDRVLSVSKRDDYGRKEGICFQYDAKGKITRVSEWNEDKEVSLLKQFIGDQMIEYKNGVKRYEGGFVDSLYLNYKRQGKGAAYDKNGRAVIYKGYYNLGKRHGRGISYHHREVRYDGEWMYGMTKRCFYTMIVSIVILWLLVVIGVCMFSLYVGIALLILLLICLGIYLFNLRPLRKLTLRCGLDHKITQIMNKPHVNISKYSFELTGRLDGLALLQSIEIGHNCFGSVQTFKIEGLKRLKSVKIGNNSFTQVKDDN